MHLARRQIRRPWPKLETPAGSLRKIPLDIEAAVLGANHVHDAICAPAMQRIGPFEIATSIVPARYVSGDFILSFDLNGSRYVALGDLMGKGLSAAMWLTHVVDLIYRAGDFEQDVAGIMRNLNREMHRSRIGVPLTALFLARLEPAASRITYSCGGCPPAFLLQHNGSVKMLARGGPILGAFAESQYECCTLDLDPFDSLLAVSDGVIEVHHGRDFDLRPQQVANHVQSMPERAVLEIVQSLTTNIRMRSEVFSDDLSVLAVKRVS